jgi:1-acyl-sn-glycerol-3-phosphate acyltransferase
MAKAELFRIRGLRAILRGARQIAVYRRSPDASLALRDAITALAEGDCVVIYPEGTTTKDPDYWPMVAKTGVARLALLTGAPVVPVAQWGAQRIFGQDKRVRLRRTSIDMLVGPAIEMSDFAGSEPTVDVLRILTDRVMAAIRDQLADVRGEPAPEVVFDPRAARAVTREAVDQSEERSA